MATTAYEFAVSCPAGTSPVTPQWTDVKVPPGPVVNIHARVPRGPRGNMGFALGMARNAVIPAPGGSFFAGTQTFIIADDAEFDFGPQGNLTSGAWQVAMFNVGAYQHTVYLTITVDRGGDANVGAFGASASMVGAQV